MPSPAQTIWPHLAKGEEMVEQVQAQPSPLAQAMYPRKTKPTNPYRESLLRSLRELNARIDRRLQKERRR
jgi:hypothetical protein